jgi:hypothetical protein
MSCFPAKVMATAIVAVFLLVGDIPATSASLPYGNNSSLKVLLYIYDPFF